MALSRVNQPLNFKGHERYVNLQDAGREFGSYVNPVVIDTIQFGLPWVEGGGNLIGMGPTGTVENTEILSSGLGAVHMATTEEFVFEWLIPNNIDPISKGIDFRLLWSDGAAASTKTQTLAITYTVNQNNASDTFAVAATALDTAITAQADLAANKRQWTSWGSISANKTGIADTVTCGRDSLLCEVTATLDTITSLDLWAVQIRWYRLFI